jgi:hypothetical protein
MSDVLVGASVASGHWMDDRRTTQWTTQWTTQRVRVDERRLSTEAHRCDPRAGDDGGEHRARR